MPRMTREDAVAEYQAFFDDCERWFNKADHNPLYAWWVIHTVTGLDYDPPIPLPKWCHAFLAERTATLMTIAFDPALSPQEKAAEAAGIFAVTTQGRNYFKEFEIDPRNADLVAHYARLKAKHGNVESAVADLKEALGVSRSTIFDRMRDVPKIEYLQPVQKRK